MITPAYAQEMAAYNAWQNANLYSAADALTETDRTENRGAFFGSIEATLNHILWADRTWLSRFAKTPPANQPLIQNSTRETASWNDLKTARTALDQTIIDWAKALQQPDLNGNLRWFSGAANREMEKPLAILIMHFFNHQTHHRGQVHAMLTAAGARPGPTDLPWRTE